MKNKIFATSIHRKLAFILAAMLIPLLSCKKTSWESESEPCTQGETVNPLHPKGAALQEIIDRYTKAGLPGVSIAIYSANGYWAGASGYAKIETNTPMEPCNLQYAQSVTKTYMAVEILKLYEDGKVNLDDPITDYLPATVSSKVTGANNITVRMLLNHTSGVAEYNADPAYISYLLQHPLHKFTTMDYLGYINGKPAQFAPGTSYAYTNTNYELLALIGDQLTGDHAAFIRDSVFAPLGLTRSFYRNNTGYLDNPALVNTYWDRYSNSAIENCSQMQKVNVGSLIGDDGIVATPLDFVKFLKSLFDGKVLAPSTIDQMLTFVRKNPKDTYGYGLGIFTDLYKQQPEYGHNGSGIGSGCDLGYFPGPNVYFFIAINMGTTVNSPILDHASAMKDEIYDVLIE